MDFSFDDAGYDRSTDDAWDRQKIERAESIPKSPFVQVRAYIMTPTQIKTAELALGLYFGDMVAPTLPNSRLKGKMERLSKLIMREFERTRKQSKRDAEETKRIVERFIGRTGWHGKSLAYSTLCNFLLAIYDNREYGKKLIPVLNDIYAVLNDTGLAYTASLWSAALAADKWAEVIG